MKKRITDQLVLENFRLDEKKSSDYVDKHIEIYLNIHRDDQILSSAMGQWIDARRSLSKHEQMLASRKLKIESERCDREAANNFIFLSLADEY